MGTSTSAAHTQTHQSLDDLTNTTTTTTSSTTTKEAAPLPEAYKTFLDSISHKITRYLDEEDEASQPPSRKDAPLRRCPGCGGLLRPRRGDDDRRPDRPEDGVREWCRCR